MLIWSDEHAYDSWNNLQTLILFPEIKKKNIELSYIYYVELQDDINC
jgi:hypothetical protein